ncbi:DNA-binding transcriptional regulator, LysR family [Roseivivax lentus]|uniref:DNA-binding transcriptional regulator, LysR family n=1 Tax=Roseivivax lentus TaxID=633194 RepID=A0A1N7Q5M4_9RHOB|nr:LysR family transcriptional regulator [Roseivivax lentus]SIT18162.1 DNA-binding transcriptional regulator, LysR family [Roseivivax lentus]
MNWNDLKVVLSVAKTGTLAGAARDLEKDPTTVGRRIAAIEGAFRARLFDRLNSGFVPTEAGHRVIALAEQVELDAQALQNEIEGADQRIDGTVRLSGLDAIFNHLIIPQLPGLLDRYPGLEITFSSHLDFADLSRRKADIALRSREPRHPDSVGRRLGTLVQAAYSTKGSQFGPGLNLIGLPREYEGSDYARILADSFPDGTIVARASTESHIHELVRAGVGIGILDCFVGDTDPTLKRVLPNPVWTQTAWTEVHLSMARAPRIRAVIDFLQDIFTENANLLAGKRSE